MAVSRKEPLSLSLSFGSSYSGHSGADDTEKIYADMAGAGKAGIAVAVAAGNDGAHGAHAGGKISASIQGAASHDFHAKALFETDGTAIAVFNKQDDWALDLTADEVLGTSPSKEFTADGKRLWLSVKADGDKVKITAHDQDWKDITVTADQQNLFEKSLITQGDTAIVSLHLPAGKYWLYPRGDSASVTDGTVDFYMIEGRGEFISGANTDHLVSSPGNSANVITVGAYSLLDEWMTPSNVDVTYNVGKGNIAPFSSGGYRRDGAVKPDICAPGNFMISAKASALSMPHADGDLVAGGDYLAWSGTSASTPYAA